MAGDATRGLITSALLLIDRRPWGVRKLAEQRYIVIAKAVLGADINKIISKLQDAPNAKEGLREAVNNCKKSVRRLIDEKKATH